MTVGASGAIFGLMGCLDAMLTRYRKLVHVRDGRIGLVVGIWAVWQLIFGFMSPMVASFANSAGSLRGASWERRSRHGCLPPVRPTMGRTIGSDEAKGIY